MKTQIMSVDLSDVEAREFFKKWTEYASERISPSYIGCKFINFTLELKEGGFVVSYETDRKLNQGSWHMILYLLQGFLSGWKAKGVKSTP